MWLTFQVLYTCFDKLYNALTEIEKQTEQKNLKRKEHKKGTM